jgi:hypothetical protein
MNEHDAGRPDVYFHVGAPKTGTTFLQRVLWQNRDALRDAGVLYPGDTLGAQVHAAFDLRQAGFQGYEDPRTPGAWAALVAEAQSWAGPVIISQELFSPATAEQIDAALADLSFADLHIVYTARELSRQIPAAWQEDLKNRFTPTFDEFVAALRDPDHDLHGLGRMFWRMQDAPVVLERWTRHINPDRVHVITVPHRREPPDVLWRRFCDVVKINAEAYDISQAFTNTSLGTAETNFLRQLNLALGDDVGWPLYDELVKHVIAQDVLGRRPNLGRPVLRPEDAEWLAERSQRIVDQLATAGYEVVGSLDDLLPIDDPTQAEPAADAENDDQAGLAVEVAVALLQRMAKQRGSMQAVETLVRALAVTSTPDPGSTRQRRRGAVG